MKKLILTVFIGGNFTYVFSQETFTHCGDACDTAGRSHEIHITLYAENQDNTVYTGMQKIINANLPLSYIAWPKTHDQSSLKDGEGRNGYILEGNMDLVFPLWQGRNQTSRFFQNKKVSFRYNPTLRMTNDNSAPIYPTNQKVGFQFDQILFNSYVNKRTIQRRAAYKPDASTLSKYGPLGLYDYDARNWQCTNENLHMLYLTVNAMHYSNGQSGVPIDSSFLPGLLRNNYTDGNFSTNYLNVNFTYAYLRNHWLISASAGYQHDDDWFGPFEYEPAQRGRYGKERIVGYIQVRTKPHRIRGRSLMGWKDLRCANNPDLKVMRMASLRLRYEYEWILDKAQINGGQGNQHLFNQHFYGEYLPMRSRAASLLIHVYYGRDYMNIRYDNSIFGIMGGIAFTLYKYVPPRFKNEDMVQK